MRKEIILLSSRPWRHAKYLHELHKTTGYKINFYYTKPYHYEGIVFRDLKEFMIPKEPVLRQLKGFFHQVNLKMIEGIQDIEYSNNSVIFADMQPGNVLSYQFCSCKQDLVDIYYLAETPDIIIDVCNKFDDKHLLIPTRCNDCYLEYDTERLEEIVSLIQ